MKKITLNVQDEKFSFLIELLGYLDFVEVVQPESPATIKDFRGTLSKESAAKLQEKVKKEREEWN
ncbi:hypothetical protein [Leptospira santarosai]|uniref:Uncharacterized protein n=1 Tax=Leptospira santarosai TaxID=28183 RepID=A0AB73MWG5_9LEPT|nr:hypothetical protein [Leptospira santarosai]AVV51413.1 Uncharacterized protein XB17_02836 [Leptospira santarosai]OLY64822.1 hypothetical protein BWD11_07210 [Leptospira santarosai serovar Grippotyphosa]ONF77747.1 hypothetical protein BWD12_14515 [Leptospira santarosai serovar Bananal]ONF90737.1 hypothetical protein BWD14_19400 [Leptospira santarosai]